MMIQPCVSGIPSHFIQSPFEFLNTIKLLPFEDYLLSVGQASVRAAQALLDKGERIVVVSSLVPNGDKPWMLERPTGQAAFVNSAVNLINFQIRAELSKLTLNEGQRALFWDLNRLFKDISTNPVQYGFTDIKEPCMRCAALVKNATSGKMVPDLNLKFCSGLEPAVLLRPFCSTPDSYLWWDEGRPTAAGHRLIAADLASLLKSNGLLQD